MSASATEQLPAGWRRVRFGDVVRQVKGKVDPHAEGIERYVAGEHMDTDDLRIRRWGEVGDGYLGPAFHRLFRPGQVLYGSRRTYLRKVAIADFEGVCANTTFVVESDSPELLGEFLPYVMTTEAFHSYSISKSKGSTNPYINFSDLVPYEFALPPLAEQERIVQVLDAGRASHERIKRGLEAASVLLEAVVHEAVTRCQSEHAVAELASFAEEGRPITYGILKPGVNVSGGVPVVKVRDYPNGRVLTDQLLLTDPRIAEEYRRSSLRAGDLLFSIRGTIGRVAAVPPGLDGANITQDTARLSISDDHDTLFVRFVLESGFVQDQVQRQVTGLAVQGINLRQLRRVLLPAPEKRVQSGWRRRFQSAEEMVTSARAHLEQSKQTQALLRERLLKVEA